MVPNSGKSTALLNVVFHDCMPRLGCCCTDISKALAAAICVVSKTCECRVAGILAEYGEKIGIVS